MSNRQATYTINLNNNVIRSLEQTEAAALRVDNVMAELNRTMSMFGLAFGAQFVINLGEEWVKTAASFEQSMLRIKNASSDVTTGLKNQLFITDIADKFRIDLEKTADSYGNFLFKIKNANLGTVKENRLFEQLTAISKVSGLSQGELDATVRNISILLGEGVLEARHLRGLSYVHPQLIPFLADELGLKDHQRDEFSNLLKHSDLQAEEETKLQKFSQMISSGKLTKLGLPADLIIGAMNRYYESIKDKVPETLTLVESELNSLGNLWFKFKKDLVLDNKTGVVDFLHDLGDGIKFLSEHSSGITEVVKDLSHLIKLYLGWRLAILALQAPLGILSFINNEKIRLTSTLNSYTTSLSNSTKAQIESNNVEKIIYDNKSLYSEKEGLFVERKIELRNLSILAEEEYLEKTNIINNELLSIQENFANRHSLLNEWMIEKEAEYYEQIELINSKNSISYQEYLEKSTLAKERLIEYESVYNTKLNRLKKEEFEIINQNNAEILAAEEEYNLKMKSLRDEAFITNNSMALSQIEKGKNSLIGGALSFLGTGLMNVFVAGIATDVIATLLIPRNTVSKEDWHWSNLGNTATGAATWLLSKATIFGYGNNGGAYWTPFGSGETLQDYSRKIGINKDFEKYVGEWSDFSKPSGYDFFTGKFTKEEKSKISVTGNDLFNLIKEYDEALKTNHPDINYNLMDLINPLNEFGKRFEDNSNILRLLKSSGINLNVFLDQNIDKQEESFFPYVSLEAKHQAEEQSKTTKALHELNKGTSKLKGNTVTNIHISWTGGMNGMVNPTFTVTSDVDIENLEEKVGDIIVKKLTDAVNDAQYLH